MRNSKSHKHVGYVRIQNTKRCSARHHGRSIRRDKDLHRSESSLPLSCLAAALVLFFLLEIGFVDSPEDEWAVVVILEAVSQKI